MYWKVHTPAHVHAFFSGDEALVRMSATRADTADGPENLFFEQSGIGMRPRGARQLGLPPFGRMEVLECRADSQVDGATESNAPPVIVTDETPLPDPSTHSATAAAPAALGTALA